MRTFKSAAIIFFMSLIPAIGQSQNVQWAGELEFQYNSFAKSGGWSGHQVLGKPDAQPWGSLNENAFRIIKEAAYGTLTISFNTPQPVKEILIIESFLPGRVAKVMLYDGEGKEYTIYESTASNVNLPYRGLTIPIEKTSFNVHKLSLHVNTIGAPGWTQIDAVGISSEPIPESYIKEIGGDENIVVSEQIVFSAKKEKLGGMINTEYKETKPIISPDGDKLFFVRQDYPSNLGGKRDAQDIYISDFVTGRWRLAKNAGRPLNDGDPNGVCSISPDGNTMLVINAYGQDGHQIGKGVSISHKTGSGWSQPARIEINGFTNRSQYEDYYLSNSGTALLMAIDGPGSYGAQDLYVSARNEDGTFSRPVNLGSSINTSGSEFSPFLASDNRTLYFASDGHGGHGQSDIYYSRRIDNSWTNWTIPANIGDEINSSGWDAYYTVPARGDYAYFISSSDEGKRNINTDIYRISLKKEIKPDPVVMITGRVLNKNTNQPIEADINYESLPYQDEEGLAISNPSNGAYKIVVPAGKKYGIVAEAKGFISVHENLDFTAIDEYAERKKDLYLVPIEKGQIVQLNNLFFKQSESEILPESEPELERLYQLMSENPDMEIQLRGHTDNRGYFKANLELSQERADAVMNYLIDKGIARRRVTAKGFGPTLPLASNETPEGRRKNRRVEVEVLEI